MLFAKMAAILFRGRWVNYMMVSWHGTLSTLWALCEGNPLVTMDSPHKGPVMQSLDVFFDGSLNKQLINFGIDSDLRCHATYVTSL